MEDPHEDFKNIFLKKCVEKTGKNLSLSVNDHEVSPEELPIQLMLLYSLVPGIGAGKFITYATKIGISDSEKKVLSVVDFRRYFSADNFCWFKTKLLTPDEERELTHDRSSNIHEADYVDLSVKIDGANLDQSIVKLSKKSKKKIL